MNALAKLTLALVAASFCASAPAMALEAPASPDPAQALKTKAEGAIEKGKEKIAKDLGLEKKAPAAKSEEVNVTEETVTVETPQGTASETTVTVTPEGKAAPAAPEAPAK